MLKYYLVMVFCSQPIIENSCVKIQDKQAFSTISECMIKGIQLSSDFADIKNIKIMCLELTNI